MANSRKIIKNTGFGNRCSICGHAFDEGGICAQGHEQGKTYEVNPDNPGETKEVP